MIFCVIPVGIPPHLRKRFQISTEYAAVCSSFSSKMKFVARSTVSPCALIPVYGNTVPHLILDHQHTQAFELLSQLLDIKADNTVVDIHIGTVVKNIQAAMHIQFQRRRDPLRLRLRLPLDLVIQIFQQRHILRAGVCDIGAVHDPHSTVNDRLFHRLQTVPCRLPPVRRTTG